MLERNLFKSVFFGIWYMFQIIQIFSSSWKIIVIVLMHDKDLLMRHSHFCCCCSWNNLWWPEIPWPAWLQYSFDVDFIVRWRSLQKDWTTPTISQHYTWLHREHQRHNHLCPSAEIRTLMFRLDAQLQRFFTVVHGGKCKLWSLHQFFRRHTLMHLVCIRWDEVMRCKKNQ